MSKTITVHIADDHKILIDGIIALLKTEKNIEFEGYSLTGKAVIDWYEPNKADVLVLDINMPELDGIEVLKVFKKRKIEQKVIILSGISNPKVVQEIMNLGASGFLEKGSASEYIIEAIETVCRGKKFYTDDVKNSLLDLYVNDSKSTENIKNTISVPLTEREIEVLKLITQELSSSEIAKKLGLSVKTIENHRSNLYKKVKVKNVVGLTIYAVKNNLV